jgi:hypothetical protein
MKKRGQILGMPLVLLFGLIVGAFILLYGAKWVLDLTEEAEYVELLGVLDDLENNIETFGHYDAGSSKVYALSLSEDVDTVCFYDWDAATDDCYIDGDACGIEITEVLDLVEDDTYNVYLLPQGVFDRTRFGIEYFGTVDGNPVCVSNGGSILIEADEDYATIAYYAP